jgi:magnesium transporter
VLEQERQQRTIRSSNLLLVLAQLEAAFKRRSKQKRSERRAQIPRKEVVIAKPGVDTIPEGSERAEGFVMPPILVQPRSGKILPKPGQAWWLDVSSPLWEDMQKIGKLLHLHPLTLEDIFYQESREKLELFPALGYYFIVFRALAGPHSTNHDVPSHFNGDSSDEKSPTKTKMSTESTHQEGESNPLHIKAVNVYLVVFRDGILSVSFTTPSIGSSLTSVK